MWWSGSISSFGDWATLFASVALASYIVQRVEIQKLTAVVPLVARIIPALLSSFAGLIADRFDKKLVMIFYILQGCLSFILFFAEIYFIFIINFFSEIFSLIKAI